MADKTCVCGSKSFRQQNPLFHLTKLVRNEEPILICTKCGKKNEYVVNTPIPIPFNSRG